MRQIIIVFYISIFLQNDLKLPNQHPILLSVYFPRFIGRNPFNLIKDQWRIIL